MADWTLATSRDDHLDEHNQFDHTDLASLTEGRVLGVSGGYIKQLIPTQVATATFIDSGDSPYTVLTSDTVVMVDTTSGNVTVTLPLVSTVDGQAILVKHIDGSNVVAILRSGSDIIDTDGNTDTSRDLDTYGGHWSGVAADAYSSWFTIGVHGTVS
jgi:hypothetical protein